ncbi:MAG: zf-TFIIB domain-containing protein [Acidobacteriota bacterium]|nr:zf-TFIIB domain-containing protein [Acidobacteriota bacterium]
MNCPSCGAPMHAERDTLKCDYCGSVVVPQTDTSGVRVLVESPDREQCPVCSVTLMQATLGISPLLYCTKCHGMLIAMMEFQSLIDAARTASGPVVAYPADPHELNRVIQCPHCHRPMEAHFYAGAGNVVMDTCETCCLHWLDHDEVARIARSNSLQTNTIDNDPASFYDPTLDRPDAAVEVMDILGRIRKSRI